MRNLKPWEIKLLNEGNQYTFAHLVFELYPDLCEKLGFTYQHVVNSYKAWTDFSDGIYTLYGDDGIKYFFNCEMKFRGTKC